MAMNTKQRAASESVAFLAIIGAILVVLNIVAATFPLGRFDTTRTHTYSLSSGSKRIARSLTDEMVITAYFSENEQLGEQYVALERGVRDLLEEYRAASNGRIKIRVVHPSTDAEREAATEAGVTLAQQQVLRNDSVTMVEGFRGLSITYLANKKQIPVIASTDGLEYRITSLMQELVGRRSKIGVLTGHGSPTLAQGLSALKRGLTNYDVVEVDAASPIARDVKALLIVGPTEALTEPELRNIDTYVMQGGSLGIFGGGLNLNLQGEGGMPSLTAVDSGLNRLLRPWGLEIRSDMLIDARANRMQWPSRDGRPMLVQHPAFPIIAMEESAREHAATYQISDAIFPITSTINRKPVPRGASVRVLAKSSEQSWSGTGEAITLEIESMRPTNAKGPFPVMAVIEGRLPSAFAAGGQSTAAGEAPPSGPQSTSRDVRIAVVGSSLLVRDELLGPPERLDENTIAQGLALPMNVVDWLANDRDLIAIRAKSVEDPTLDVPTAVSMAQQDINAAVEARDEEGATAALERGKAALEAWDRKKDLYKYLNWFGIPILFAIFGIIRWRMRLRMKAALAVR